MGKLTPLKTEQEKINQLIFAAFLSLKRRRSGVIVRFKGGDPSIFGRMKEEIAFALEKKIPFEIVPGVSSFHAVPTYAGIPLTARGIAGNFSVLTGHFENPHKKIKIIKASDTTVYLMGIKNLTKIVDLNLKSGKSPQTPIAIIEKGTLPTQKTLISTLAKVVAEAKARKISHPGVIVIGKIVKLGKDFAWYEKQPLFGKNIGILKENQELKKLSQLILANGGNLLTLPLLKFKKITKNHPELLKALETRKFKTIVFTSAPAVKEFFEIFKQLHQDARYFANYKIVVIGSETEKTLNKYHLKADYLGEEANQEGVWQTIKKNKLNNILFPKAKVTRDFLEKKWLEEKIEFKTISLYEYEPKKTTLNQFNQPFTHQLARLLELDFLIFTSSLSVKVFHEHWKKIKISQQKLKEFPHVITMGKTTHETMHSLLPPALTKNSHHPKDSSFAGLVTKIMEIVAGEAKQDIEDTRRKTSME